MRPLYILTLLGLTQACGIIPGSNSTITGSAIQELKIKEVAVGEGHSCALSSFGSLSCWGDNLYGQLGVGDRETRSWPERVRHPKGLKWSKLAASNYNTCAVDEEKHLYCWGAGFSGINANWSNTEIDPHINLAIGKVDELYPIPVNMWVYNAVSNAFEKASLRQFSVNQLVMDENMACVAGSFGPSPNLKRACWGEEKGYASTANNYSFNIYEKLLTMFPGVSNFYGISEGEYIATRLDLGSGSLALLSTVRAKPVVTPWYNSVQAASNIALRNEMYVETFANPFPGSPNQVTSIARGIFTNIAEITVPNAGGFSGFFIQPNVEVERKPADAWGISGSFYGHRHQTLSSTTLYHGGDVYSVLTCTPHYGENPFIECRHNSNVSSPPWFDPSATVSVSASTEVNTWPTPAIRSLDINENRACYITTDSELYCADLDTDGFEEIVIEANIFEDF